jgi:hypothetical protein
LDLLTFVLFEETELFFFGMNCNHPVMAFVASGFLPESSVVTSITPTGKESGGV